MTESDMAPYGSTSSSAPTLARGDSVLAGPHTSRRVIAFLAEGIQRTVYSLHPRYHRQLRIVMARRDAAGLRDLTRRPGDPAGNDDDWRSWPATGHSFLGFPVELDDAVDRPEVRPRRASQHPVPRRSAVWRMRKRLAEMLEPEA